MTLSLSHIRTQNVDEMVGGMQNQVQPGDLSKWEIRRLQF